MQRHASLIAPASLCRRGSRNVGVLSIPAQSIHRSQDDQCCARQLIDLWQEGTYEVCIISNEDEDRLMTAQPGQHRSPHLPRGTESLHAADGRRAAQPGTLRAIEDLVIQRAPREHATSMHED